MKSKGILFAFLSGILLALSYPPISLGFFAWFALVPLFYYLFQSKDLKYTIILGFISSITSNLIILNWIAINSGTSVSTAIITYFSASLYLTIFWIFFSIGVHFTPKRIKLFFVPLLWVFIVEILRNFGSLAFPWLDLSITQSNYNRIIQLISIESHTISFIIILFNILIHEYLVSRKSKFILYFSTILLVIMLIGNFQLNYYNKIQPKTFLNISIGQPVIFPDEKWDRELRQKNFQIMESLLLKSLEEKAEIIVWPEVSVPSYLATNINDRLFFQERLMENDSFLILGIPERKFIDGQHFSYNSVMVMYPNGDFSTYQKLFLVPFAEYVPFFKSWLTKINQFDDMGSFTPGSEYKVFPVKDYKIATLICYDSSNPKIVKTMVQNGADILFIVTNDSYVGEFMPYQHFELAKLRAIEQRIPVVQSANNGISGIILPSGKVIYKSNLNERVVHTEKIPIYE